ncbi:hypothetical protein [Metabacillus litoralis]|uniref:hypothetical protein n=1 Tax=Metabacillus litoralis TaxID=152268 RepID=UPI001CFE40AE|nr:hypothetical protein [Metabacillus litoralis]
MNRTTPLRVKIDLTFFIIQTFCILGLLLIRNYDYMKSAITDPIFWLIYVILEYKQKWIIPIYVRIVVVISMTTNDFLGELFNLYVTSVLFDRVQHIFGTYSMTLWSFFIIQQFAKTKILHKKLIVILFILLSTSLGALYEIFEFIQDIVFKPKIKNQPSLLDTDLDLISDLSGGIIALCHFLLSRRLRTFIGHIKSPIKI